MLTTILFGILIWTLVSIPVAFIVGKCFSLSSTPDESESKLAEKSAAYRARLSADQTR